MHSALQRASAAFAAGIAASMLTGFAYGLHAPPGLHIAHSWRLAGLLAVPGFFAGVGAAVLAALCTPSLVARVRNGLMAHSRGFGAATMVTPPAAMIWLGAVVLTLRRLASAFHNAGLAALLLGVTFLAYAVAIGVAGLVAGGFLSRRLPESPASFREAFGRPALVGFGLATAFFAYGLLSGDAQGRGGLFAGFAVVLQPEVDLIPALMAGCIVTGTAVFAYALRRRGPAAALAMLVFSGSVLYADAVWYGRSPAGARIDARPGPVQILVEALRRRTDRDHDGHSVYFGGGDCDDHDARRNPDAQEIPANGVDEDCSGLDAPSIAPAAPTISHEALMTSLPADMNLVVITVDALRADMLGGERAREVTPNLSRLAAQGVSFDHAYALSSNTMHALGPLMSGRYPTECPRDAEHFTGYLPENVMLAERLRDSGFWTSGVASHFYFEPSYGLTQGIDHWDASAHMHGDDAPWVGWDDRVADHMIAQLRRAEAASGRFFVWAHFFDPHHPYAPHPGLPPRGGGDDRAMYEREVAFTDRQVGRVLDALDALPAARRTIVVLTADHGEAFGEHGTHWHGVELWDELVRVPLVLRVPQVPPRRVSAVRSQIDLAPTLLELLRVPLPAVDAPDAFSGRSLVADLMGVREPERPIYMELLPDQYNRLRRAVVYQGWKLLERGAGRFELYHLDTDPEERVDVATSDPRELARMLTIRESVRARLHVVAPVRATPGQAGAAAHPGGAGD